MLEKSAPIRLELKDLDNKTGSGVIRHSVYNSIDLTNDISTHGMFTKSWNEAKASNIRQKIALLFDHDTKDKIGYVTNVYDDSTGAYTEFKLFDSQKDRIVEFADNEILTGASFGYQAVKKEFVEIKGKKVRKLLEVKHFETSLLDIQPAHPEAGIVILNKSLEDISDDDINELLTWGNEHITSLKEYIQKIDNYCHKAKASDETIIALQTGLNEYKQLLTQYDTAFTALAKQPIASDDESNAITNLITLVNVEVWKKQSLSNYRN